MPITLIDITLRLRIMQSGPLAGKFFTGQLDGAPEIILPSGSYPTFTGGVENLNPAAFEVPTLHANAKRIYVSNSGSNSFTRDTTSALQPVATLAHAFSISQSGDWILLDCNGTWNEQIRGHTTGLKPGINATYKSVLGFYNTGIDGRRPLISRQGAPFWANNNTADVQNVLLTGIEFYNPAFDPGHPNYANTQSAYAHKAFFSVFGNTSGMTIQDCKFNFVELTFQRAQNLRPRNLKVNRNIFRGSHVSGSSTSQSNKPSNLFMSDSGHEGWVEIHDNCFDYGGWYPDASLAGANQYNHHIYIHESCGNLFSAKRNFWCRASSLGMHLRKGGIQEHNYASQCAVGIQSGYNASAPVGWVPPEGYIRHMLDNVVSEGASQQRGPEACSVGGLCSGAVWGMAFPNDPQVQYSSVITGNIVSKIATGTRFQNAGGTLVNNRQAYSGVPPNTTFANNIAYKWNNDTQGVGPSYVDPERTLGSYAKMILDNPAMDEYVAYDWIMDTMVNRGLGQVNDSEFSALTLVNYTKSGFALA